MNKKLIRLTESDLHRIIKESIKKILDEVSGYDYGYIGKPKRTSTTNVNSSNSVSSSNVGTNNAYNKGVYDDSVGDDLRASRGVLPNDLIHDDGDAAALRFARSRFGRRY